MEALAGLEEHPLFEQYPVGLPFGGRAGGVHKDPNQRCKRAKHRTSDTQTIRTN